MHIHKLQLERFRGAQRLPLELNERLNVFVGMNGAGKSSILDATAILLSWLVNRIKHAGASGRPISETDIRNGESSANLEIALKLNQGGGDFIWNIVKARKGHSKKDAVSGLIPASEAAKSMQNDISSSNGQVKLQVVLREQAEQEFLLYREGPRPPTWIADCWTCSWPTASPARIRWSSGWSELGFGMEFLELVQVHAEKTAAQLSLRLGLGFKMRQMAFGCESVAHASTWHNTSLLFRTARAYRKDG